MAYTGYSSSGSAYNIASQRGMDFISSAPAGATLVGGDGSNWSKQSDGTTQISKDGTTWTVGNALGSLQNSLDMITAQADKTSARNLDYARQHQEWSANQAAIANSFNAAEAAKNRDWQQMMSNTAHQREVADLKAAGLNPVLSAMGGNGASVTSGATASATLPSGASAQAADTTGALVSILGSMLSAQTAIANQAVSARTQEAVADKYTAMSLLTEQIAAATSRSNAETAASASRYGSDMSAKASMYGSELAAEASKYASLVNRQNNMQTNRTNRWITNENNITKEQIAILESQLKQAGISSDILRSIIGIVPGLAGSLK